MMSRQAPVVQSSPESLPVAWPPDYPAVLRERIKRLDKLRSNPKLLTATKLHYQKHPDGILHFIEDWAVTYDPRRKDGPKWMPMVLWQRQREFIQFVIECYRNEDDGLSDKCRGAGVTWLAVWISLGLYLWDDGCKVGWGSRKEQLVDRKGDMDSIFEKIRESISRLPGELLPTAWNEGLHSAHLKITNPENGSGITGEAGDNIGRGGRNSIYFVDEAAFIERPQKIEASLSDNTNCRMDLSTPNGMGNPFYRKRFGGVVKVFSFDWRDDPRRTQVWYDRMRRKLDSLVFAQEIDRDYEGSAEDVIIHPKWIRAAIGLELPATGVKVAGLDVADEGPDANALAIRQGPVLQVDEEWKKGTTTQTTRKAVAICQMNGCPELRYDSVGVGAGVKGELGRDSGGLAYIGVNSGSKVQNPRGWHVRPTTKTKGVRNQDAYANLKAQMWWSLRQRFERTWEHVNGVQEYHPDDLITLPIESRELVMELSGPQYDTTTGKIRIESKKHMKERGLKSPNRGDAVVIAYAPMKIRSLTW